MRDQVYGNLSNAAQGVRAVITEVWVPTLEGQMQMLAGDGGETVRHVRGERRHRRRDWGRPKAGYPASSA